MHYNCYFIINLWYSDWYHTDDKQLLCLNQETATSWLFVLVVLLHGFITSIMVLILTVIYYINNSTIVVLNSSKQFNHYLLSWLHLILSIRTWLQVNLDYIWLCHYLKHGCLSQFILLVNRLRAGGGHFCEMAKILK